ncbi:hypothetical protein [Streptomyces sp. NPDC008001]|uniref:hypothetical protein n=1 Tax=Streptomyces sp. NPDC008001 TaxID=3364804 RepID=UPI0036E3092B
MTSPTPHPPQPHDLPPERPLFRLYRRTLNNGRAGNPLWFCPGETNPAESCRFDLHRAVPGRADPGTCYTAEEATTAFLEAFKNACGVGVPDQAEIGKNASQTSP